MKHLSFNLRLLLITLILMSVSVMLWSKIFGWHRPYVNWAPWNLAQYLVDHHRPASDCLDLLWAEIMSPSQAEQRALCVHEYAKLAKDPTACELLMPSSYGLDCVGGAQERFDICSLSEKVYWEVGNANYADCRSDSLTRSKLGNECCLIARVTFVKSENDCSRLSSEASLHDECLRNLAFKNHSPDVCSGIPNANTRSACEVESNALLKDPSICEGCKLTVDSIAELH